MRISASVCTFVLCTLLVSGFLFAQGANTAPAAPPPAVGKTDDKPVTVLFEEDRESSARLQKAAEEVRAGRIQQALDLYAWAVENAGPGLVSMPDGRLLRARDLCNRAMTMLPADSLAGYRTRVDAQVARQYEDARQRMSPEALQKIAEQYYASSFGPEILDLAGDVYAGEGRLSEAVGCWQRLLDWGLVDVPLTREAVEAKLVPALVRLGRQRQAALLRDAIRKQRPEPTIAVGGQTTKLSDYLDRKLEATKAPATSAESSGAWREWGGDAAHGRVTPDVPVPDGKIGVVSVPQADSLLANPDWHPGIPPPQRQLLPVTAFYPVVDGGRLFVHDGGALAAVSLSDVSELWRIGKASWTPRRERRVQRGQPNLWMLPEPDRMNVCCVADGRVFASLNGATPAPQLVAADLDGKRLWTIDRTSPGFDWLNGKKALGDPVCSGGRLYFVVVNSEDARVEQTLVCVDAADGTLRWKTFLCSGGWTPQHYLASRLDAQFSLMLPAVGEGVVVVCSDLGGCIGLDSATGEPLWGYPYEQIEIPRPQRFQIMDYGTFPIACHTSTPIVHEGRAYVAPADSPSIYALDLRSGRRMWSVSRGTYDRIVGVSEGKLFLTGEAVCALDLSDGKVLWTQRDEQFRWPSPGAVTPEALLVPAPDAVIRIDPATGKILGRLPLSKEEQEFGSLITGDGVLVQVGSRIQVYGRRAEAQAKLEDRVRRNPADASAWAALGYAASRYGSAADAVRNYERALVLLRGNPAAPAALLAEVKRCLYALYRPKIAQAREAKDDAQMLDVAHRALECAITEGEELEARACLAEVSVRLKNWPQAVEQLQAFLTKPYRTAFPFEAGVDMNPAVYAQQKLSELIAEQGRSIYAAHDAAAAALLAAGGRANIEKVVHNYPNSVAAGKALLALSEDCAGQGDEGDAAGYLSDYLYGFGKDDPNREALLRRLAEYYERLGLASAVFETLDELSKLKPDAAAVTAVRLPNISNDIRVVDTLRLPLKEGQHVGWGGTYYPTGRQIVVTPDYMTYNVIDKDSGKTLWSWKSKWVFVDRFLSGPKWVLRMTDTNFDVLLRTTGERAWGLSIADLDAIGILGMNKPNFVSGMTGDRLNDGTQIGYATLLPIVWQNASSEVVMIETATGRILWTRRVPNVYSWVVLGNDRLYLTMKDHLVVIDRRTGRTLRELTLSDQPWPQPWTLLPGGRLLLRAVGRSTMTCVDVETGKAAWSLDAGDDSLSSASSTRLDGHSCFVAVTGRSQLFCWDLDAGRQLWSRSLSNDAWYADAIAADGRAVYVRPKWIPSRGPAVLEAYDQKSGEPLWKGEPLADFRVTDMAVLRDAVALCGYAYEMVPNAEMPNAPPKMKFKEAQLVCLDKRTGKVAQRLAFPDDKPGYDDGTGHAQGGTLACVGDRLWIIFANRMIQLSDEP